MKGPVAFFNTRTFFHKIFILRSTVLEFVYFKFPGELEYNLKTSVTGLN